MRHPKILIVDDDPEFLHELSLTLSGAGFEIVTAADVRTAEPILTREEPGIDLLVVDLVLPGKVSGLDVISAVTKTTPPFKILATSAVYRNAVLEYVSKHMGADAYLEKSRPGEPFKADEWINLVRRLLNRGTAGVGR